MPGSQTSLVSAYDRMQSTFAEHGLDVPFIAGLRSSYTLDEEGEPQPLTYTELHQAFVPRTQRLVVFPLDCAPEVLQLAVDATNDILDSALPPGITAYINHPSRLHMTVFYLSHVDDPRPEPYKQHGSQQASTLTDSNLQHESRVLTEAMASLPYFHVQVDRLLLADSGTLLLCSTDPTGHMQSLRQQLHKSFPGAPTKQTTIIHTSLLRILSPNQLSDQEKQKVQHLCELWTQRLRGKKIPCQTLWYLIETHYANIVGQKTNIALKDRP